MPNFDFKNHKFLGALSLAVAVLLLGAMASFFQNWQIPNLFKIQEVQKQNAQNLQPAAYTSNVSYEQAIIDAAKNVSPSVVSIVISKNMPTYETQYINPFGDMPGFDIQIPQYVQKGSKLQQVGAGSGFIVSEQGLVLTNRHVVSDKNAEYTVFTNDGKKYKAKVLALDPIPANDLALVKIEEADGVKFKPVTIGDSSGIQIGQTAIAIGNALGQFRNTVSVGIVSGLGRTISASDQVGSMSETLEDIIQTDAAINSGNSGGPLVNLKGEVIGINTAMAQGAQTIGFAIPINLAKRDIDQVAKTNKISYPFLGVRYVLLNSETKEKYKTSVDYGALVLKGTKGEPAITADSPAQEAGIKENDIILEINTEKIFTENSMSKIIRKYNPGDKVTLKILRDGKEINVNATLSERK